MQTIGEAELPLSQQTQQQRTHNNNNNNNTLVCLVSDVHPRTWDSSQTQKKKPLVSWSLMGIDIHIPTLAHSSQVLPNSPFVSVGVIEVIVEGAPCCIHHAYPCPEGDGMGGYTLVLVILLCKILASTGENKNG